MEGDNNAHKFLFHNFLTVYCVLCTVFIAICLCKQLYWTPASTHTDPIMFPDTARFDPTRFEGAGPTPFSYVPFGGGPRMCLGKEYARVEILVFLHNVIKNFRWSLQVPDEKIIYDPMPTPVEGLPVSLQSHNYL